MRDDIQQAKAVLPLPALMHQLGLGDYARKSCRSPFREDRNPSFGIRQRQDGSWGWKDFGTNEHGDEIDFLAKLQGLSQADAIRAYLEMAGVRPADPARKRDITVRLAHPSPQVGHPPAPPQVPENQSPSPLVAGVVGPSQPLLGSVTANGWPTWEEAVAQFPEHLAEVAQERGLSPEFLAQLNRKGLIGWVNGPAFPVCDADGEVISAHFRYPRTNGEKQKWDFAPRLTPMGARLTPLVIGDPQTASERHVHESQWDMLQQMEKWGWHLGHAENCCFICTRGASNGALVEGLLDGDAPVILWPQNDKPKPNKPPASEEWLETVKVHCKGTTVFRARIPTQHKDLNDWVRAGATVDDLVRASTADRTLPFQITFRTLSELRAMTFDDSDNYLGDRALAAGQPTTMLGPGAVGKSRLVMQMAICLITGRPFLDMTGWARGKKWLILQTENSNRRLMHDLTKMIDSMRLTPEETALVEECLIIHTIETDRDAILLLEEGGDFAQVDGAIQHFEPDFVVFDPLNTFTATDLNKDQDMRAVLSNIMRLVRKGNPNRVPFVVHHSLTGRAGAAKATGWDKSSYGRNSKVLYAWCRSQMNLAPADPDDETKLVLVHGKSNNGKPFPDTGVRFDEEKGLYVVNPDFDSEAFRAAVNGNGCSRSGSPGRVDIPDNDVADLFEGEIEGQDLMHLIMEQWGVGATRAKQAITVAADRGSISVTGRTKHGARIFIRGGGPLDAPTPRGQRNGQDD